MIWPAYYIVLFLGVTWLIKRFSDKKSIFLLCTIFLIQWIDLYSWFFEKGSNFKNKMIWQTELPSAEWEMLAKEYKHIFFVKNYAKIFSFLNLTQINNNKVNDAYLARTNIKRINENKQDELEYILKNGARSDTIYIFSDMEELPSLKEKGMYFFLMDDVIVGIGINKPYLSRYGI